MEGNTENTKIIQSIALHYALCSEAFLNALMHEIELESYELMHCCSVDDISMA